MELVFEVINPQTLTRGDLRSPAFGDHGGVIGCHPDCDWSVVDTLGLIAEQHAQVVCRRGEYFLIDIRGNGIVRADGGRVAHGEEIRIEDKAGFSLGSVEVVAQVRSSPIQDADWLTAMLAPGEEPSGNLGPILDPLVALQGEDTACGALDELSGLLDVAMAAQQAADHTPVDHDHLVLPRLIPEHDATGAECGSPSAPELSGPFWQQASEALGVDLSAMDNADREVVLLNAAQLLRQCVGGLQRSLLNRDELQREIFADAGPTELSDSPLDPASGVGEAIQRLLQTSSPASGASVVAEAFRQLQAHQVAMLAGSRALARGALEHFSPQQLNWEFERDSSRPVLSSAGGRWRAYLRFHHSLSRTEDWSDELLARHFTQAYRDQIRLVSTLRLDCQG